MLFDRAAGVRRDLNDQDVLNAEFRADTKQQRGHALAIGIRQLGQVAGPHQNFDIGPLTAQLGVAFNRGCETKMDGIEDRIGDVLDLLFVGEIDGANE